MRLLGQTTHGMYHDDGSDVHEDVLHAVYGTTRHQPRRRRHQTGARHPPEEEDSDSPDEDDDEDGQEIRQENQVPFGLDAQVRHDPIEVANHASPFPDPELALEYLQAVDILVDTPGIPEGYGMDPDYEYEVFESIRSGRRGRKELTVELPAHIWLPRLERWIKALHLLNSLVFAEENDQ